MGSQENIKLVEDMRAASQARDEDRYLSCWADDAIIRTAGVPRALGGVTQGKDQIRENFRNVEAAQPPADVQVRSVFADDKQVCLQQRTAATFNGTRFFKGTGKPFTTYSCVVYEIEGVRIKSGTTYLNFLDMYVQAGLVDLSTLTA